jgi:hypothetical protein
MVRNKRLLLVFFLLFCPLIQGQNGTEKKVTTGIITLYANDPVQSSFCLDDGSAGYQINGNKCFNRCSHVAFDIYHQEKLTAGIQGSERGYWVDLGPAKLLAERFGYQETVGLGQGFSSLHYAPDNQQVMILKDYENQTYQPLKEAEWLFDRKNNRSEVAIVVGHIYLLRLKLSRNNGEQVFAKFIVLAYKPGESVTLRWASM